MKEKRIISAMMTAAVFISAVSCAESPKKSDTPREIPEIVKYKGSYRLRNIDAPTGILLEIVPLNGRFLTAVMDENGSLRFYTSDNSLKEFTEREIPIPIIESGDISFKMCGAGDNTAYIAVTYNIGGNDNAEYSNTLYHISADCTIIAETPLTEIGEIGIHSITENDGKVFVTSDSLYTVSDNNGVGEPFDGGNYGGSLGISANGELCHAYFKDNVSLMKIGEKTIDLGQCGMPVSNIFGGGKYDAVFASDKGIYGISGDSVIELASNVMLGLDIGSIQTIYPVGEDFLIASYDRNMNCSKIYLITESEEEEQHEAVTLKMGVFFEEDGFSSFMSQQNGSDSYVKIEPVYYTQYDVYDKENDKQVSTGLDQLNMDIISGNAPDMAVFMDMPQYLPEKGVFTDLYNIMNDELGRDDFMPNVLKACEYDGKLYSLPSSFSVNSFVCKEKYSAAESINFDDMLEIYENAPEGTPFTSDCFGRGIFSDILYYSDYAASFKNGVYTLNHDNLKRLMEFCATLPSEFNPDENFDYDAARNQAVFSSFQAYKFSDFAQYLESFDEPVTFTGYPSETCGTLINPVNTITVLDNCVDKEAAWEVIKRMYDSPSISNGINSGFPPISETFYSWADTAKLNMNKGICNQAVKVIESANTLGSCLGHDLMSIINEEAERYFYGECTAEEAAEIIKNRTDIYVSEKS